MLQRVYRYCANEYKMGGSHCAEFGTNSPRSDLPLQAE